MNQDIMKGKWSEFKGEVRKLWGDLTDDELEQTKGNVQSIGGMLRQKFGQKYEENESKFNSLVQRFGESVSDTSERAKQVLRDDVNKRH